MFSITGVRMQRRWRGGGEEGRRRGGDEEEGFTFERRC
jgi:hypothetical protein